MNDTETIKRKPRVRTIDLVYTAMAAVLITVCSWISIPTAVPFTMQTFAIFCVLSLIGGKRGTASIIVYLTLGAVGVPVFAGFTSGVGIILGSTGGYMIGFILTGLIYWLAVSLLGKKLWVEAASLLVGLLICYTFGTAWYMIVYARTKEPIGIMTALSWCVFPFIIPDIAKLSLALLVARRIPIRNQSAHTQS